MAHNYRRGYRTDTSKQKQYFAQAKRRRTTEPTRQKFDAVNFVPDYLQNSPKDTEQRNHHANRTNGHRHRLLALSDDAISHAKPSRYELSKADGTALQKRRNTDISDEDMDAKRRKLLQQSDWSGVELQKPVIIQYPERTRSISKARSHIPIHPTISHSSTSCRNISSDAIIKIASQEYRWSPGNNSVKTRRSLHSALPTTPTGTSSGAIPSSTSRSFSSFVSESPCASRALIPEIGKENLGPQLRNSSASTLDERPIKFAAAEQQFHHPQPVRKMSFNIYEELSGLSDANSTELHITPRLNNDTGSTSRYFATANSICDKSVISESIRTSTSSKIAESPIANNAPVPNRLSLFNYSLAQLPQPESHPSDGTMYRDTEKSRCSAPSSITTPEVYRIPGAGNTDSRSDLPVYKRPVTTLASLGNQDEDIMWKKFVFGHSRLGSQSAEQPDSDTREAVNDPDSRPMASFGLETSAPEPPTRIASRAENASPDPGTRRRQGPTSAPAWSPPLLTISAGAARSGAPNPQAMTSEEEAPVYFRQEQAATGTSASSFPAEEACASQDADITMRHMTSKPESRFQPPSLFVGRLASVAVPRTGESQSDPAAAAAAEGQQSKKQRRRRKTRDAGRPDIRALPNIQGDPIEFTP